jgi:trehalose-6-phosphate synthase
MTKNRPLFHSIPPSAAQHVALRTTPLLSGGHGGAEEDVGARMWEAYEYVNQTYSDVVVEQYHDDDIVWVHNYHLFLLPAKIRLALPSCTIGFCLHLPFPTSELFRVLSHRTDILQGILCSDLISFDTFRSATHFLRACERLLGVNCSYNGVLIGKFVQLSSSFSRFSSTCLFLSFVLLACDPSRKDPTLVV